MKKKSWSFTVLASALVITLATMILAAILLPHSLQAAEIENINVKHVKGTYYASAEVLLNTAQDHVMEILTDYNRLNRLSTDI